MQANLFLWHDGKNDPCDAIITVDVIFNLLPVVELQQFFYGGKDEIVLNLFEYFENQPGTKLSASYFPQ